VLKRSGSRAIFITPDLSLQFALRLRSRQLAIGAKLIFIDVNNLTLSIITMRISNEDRSPGAINSCSTASR